MWLRFQAFCLKNCDKSHESNGSNIAVHKDVAGKPLRRIKIAARSPWNRHKKATRPPCNRHGAITITKPSCSTTEPLWSCLGAAVGIPRNHHKGALEPLWSHAGSLLSLPRTNAGKPASLHGASIEPPRSHWEPPWGCHGANAEKLRSHKVSAVDPRWQKVSIL